MIGVNLEFVDSNSTTYEIACYLVDPRTCSSSRKEVLVARNPTPPRAGGIRRLYGIGRPIMLSRDRAIVPSIYYEIGRDSGGNDTYGPENAVLFIRDPHSTSAVSETSTTDIPTLAERGGEIILSSSTAEHRDAEFYSIVGTLAGRSHIPAHAVRTHVPELIPGVYFVRVAGLMPIKILVQ